MSDTTPDHDDIAVRRAFLALVVAAIDGDCDQRVHELLCVDRDPHFAVLVAHHAAHDLVDAFEQPEHEQMRADVAAELLELAGEP